MTEETTREDWRMHRLHRAPRALRILGMVVAGVVFAAAFALIFGWLVMILWNWIMPPIFHLGEIGYWQGFGILLLAKIVFGAFGSRGPGHGRGHGGPWGDIPFGRHFGRRGDWHDDREWWRYAHDFWKEEGRDAFEKFVDRKRSEAAGASEKV